MSPCLLGCVVFCLLQAGLVDSGVTQTPRYLIKARGQRGTLGCSPVSGHLSVYWYQQALGQGPQFLVQYYSQNVYGEAQLPDRFSGEQFSDSSSELNLTSLELTDSAVYLCASSQDTALHDQHRSSFSTGAVLAGVTQDTRFQVMRTGQNATLKCTQDLGHDRMYWYGKDLGHRLRLIHFSDGLPTTEARSPAPSQQQSWVPDVAMGSRLLCCVTLRLLGAGLVDSEVTQTPKYLIKSRKQQVTLRCSPDTGHLSVYWYQQALGQSPQFPVQYYDGEIY
ncbi:hypothetical protein MG293_006198 [Ovis ammon polii]|nr:hypothetical protein MG293_006198 [Ovis ammon polii]